MREVFLDTLAAKYELGVRTVDFTSGNTAEAAIDAWADEQTAGRIKRLFYDLDPYTVLVLANAIYFRGDWTYQFGSPIGAQTFMRSDGSTVQTALMNREAMLRYAAGDGWQAVELPYARA